MATFRPVYYATVYAPRSVDPNEVAALVPASTAPHAQPFRVASKDTGKAVRIGATTSRYLIRNPVGTWPTTALSVETWARHDVGIPSDGTFHAMLSYAVGSSVEEILLGIRTVSGAWKLEFWVKGSQRTTSVTYPNDGLYHHVAATWLESSDVALIYFDGVLVDLSTLSGGAITGGGAFVVGQEQDSQGGGFEAVQAWLGELDEVRVYSSVLSAEGVKQHAAGLFLDETGLVGRWGFDEEGVPQGWDDSPAANHLTAEGTVPGTEDTVLRFRSYLDGDSLRGRQGRLDLLTRRTDGGSITFRLVDKKLGTTNLERWGTAFLATAAGEPRLPGCRVLLEESLDGGRTRAAYYSGRVGAVEVGLTQLGVQVLDGVMDLRAKCFISEPHSSITYASRVPLLPLGQDGHLGFYSWFSRISTLPLRGTITKVIGADKHLELTIDQDQYRDWDDNYVSRVVWDLLTRLPQPSQALTTAGGDDYLRVHLKKVSAATEGELRVFGLGNALNQPVGSVTRYKVGTVHARELSNTQDPRYITATSFAVSDQVHVYLVPGKSLKISEKAPLLVGGSNVAMGPFEVHPVQLWKDLLDGKFGYLDAAGAPTRPIAYDAAAFNALIADESIGRGRWVITKQWRLSDFIEQQLCVPFNLAYRIDAGGRVVPLDLRRPNTAQTVPTITDADLDPAVPAEWVNDRSAAITRVEATHYADAHVLQTLAQEGQIGEIKDYPPAMLRAVDHQLIVTDLSSVDLPESTYAIDAQGFRAGPDPYESVNPTLQAHAWKPEYNEKRLLAVVNELRPVFGRGTMVLPLTCRRTSNTSRLPGQFVLVDVDAVPDLTTNRRGGLRLLRVLERTEDGPRRLLRCLDTGLNVVAAVPTVGATVLETGNTKHGLKIPITLNAAGDPVSVWVAVTATSVGTVPAETSASWKLVERATASGDVFARDLPAGRRVWARARSEPAAGDELRLPSAWVFDPGGSEDLTALAAPTSPSVGTIKDKSVRVTWTNGESNEDVVIYLASPNSGTLVLNRRLPPGSVLLDLVGLTPSTSYRVEVGHADAFGGESARVGADFTTNTTTVKPAAPRIAIYLGRP